MLTGVFTSLFQWIGSRARVRRGWRERVTTVGSLLGVALSLSGCKSVGVQGGDLKDTFVGVEQIEALSPTAVQLSWSLESRFSEYRVYQKGTNGAIGGETFSSTVIRSLQPNTEYSFAVTGVQADGRGEVGLDEFVTIRTFAPFHGISSGSLNVKSATRVDLTWTLNSPTAKYRIFRKDPDRDWDFTAPIATVSGLNMYSATGLESGSGYCFFVVASYADGTSEPATSSLAAVDAAAPCVTTDSELSGLPLITVNTVVPGTFPWFVAAGGDPSYVIDIYDAATDTVVASRTGNGVFRSFSSVAPGLHSYYAIVKSTAGQARVEMTLNGSGDSVFVRSLRESGSWGPIYPRLVAGGQGVQSLGKKVVRGDFNCDGLPDLALSAPTATAALTDQHFQQSGAVLVYYTYDPPPYVDPDLGVVVDPSPALKTDVSPSEAAIWPNPVLIHYPVTASGYNLGTDLAVGNVNGDCYRRSDGSETGGSCDSLFNEGASISLIRQCDDLAMSSATGHVFVAFGDPLSGLVTGSGASSFGVNELTCDPVSSTCRLVRLDSGGAMSGYGAKLAFGDFNNDGFDDLVISGRNSSSGFDEVHVLRGSPQGVYPRTSSKAFADIKTGAAVMGDPEVIPPGNLLGPAFAANNAEEFGSALAAVPNSRLCVSDGTYTFRPTAPPPATGYDFTKCDDLVIGAPGRASERGSIFTCKGHTPTMADPETDKGRIVSWSCREHYPTELGTIPARYGASLLGVENQNGYPLDNIIGTINTTPNVTGALFVGAPQMTVGSSARAGKVYGYYVTPQSSDFATGGIQGLLGTTAHSVTAQNEIPCNAQNNNQGTTLKHCEHQALFNSPPQADSQFGGALGTLVDIESVTRGLPYLAVAAPKRSVLSSDGTRTISGSGLVYVFKPDLSTLGIDSGAQVTQTQLSDDTSTNCTSNCTWYSGGVSPYGPSLLYPPDLSPSSFFGEGGIVGGDFNGDGTGDLVSSAYGSAVPVEQNGTVFLFESEGAFAASETGYDLMIADNVSKELNYRFEQGKVVGDLNGDGYDDVAAHILSGSSTEMVIFYGSSTGLVTTPAPSTAPVGLGPLLVRAATDTQLGKQFYRIGSVNGDAFDDVLLIGAKGSYVYYGSFTGLIANTEPLISPIGRNPLKFAVSGSGALSFHLASSPLFGVTSPPLFYDTSNQSVAYGDFNGDSCSDIVISLDDVITLPGDVPTSGLDYSAASTGRVVIIYGSAEGPQTDRTDGKIQLSESGLAADVVVSSPCSGGSAPVCKVQMLASAATGGGDAFGYGLLGLTSLEESSGEVYDELLIGDPDAASNAGRVYLYKGSATGLVESPAQTLVPQTPGDRFGMFISSVGDVNGDDYQDIAISAPEGGDGFVYIFYSGNVGGALAFFGASSLAATDYWTPAVAVNSAHAEPDKPRPQVVRAGIVSDADQFGYGVASAGDFNMDGFGDLAVNVPAGDYDLEVTQESTGYVLIYFGGPLGLRALEVPSETPGCYGGATPACEPYKIYLPNREPYENTFVSSSSSGDINGDGRTDLLLGGFGRTHPSGLAYSSGVIYVLY